MYGRRPRQEPGEHLHGCCFSAAVLAEGAKNIAAPDAKAHMIDRDEIDKTAGQPHPLDRPLPVRIKPGMPNIAWANSACFAGGPTCSITLLLNTRSKERSPNCSALHASPSMIWKAGPTARSELRRRRRPWAARVRKAEQSARSSIDSDAKLQPPTDERRLRHACLH